MCGIGGVRRFGKTPITGEEIVLMLCELEHRGLHATGLALVNEGKVAVHKAPEPAWVFTKSAAFKEFLDQNLTEDTEIALLHTRWATTGDPVDNANNHPMWDGETAIVHNGMISNHYQLFQSGKYEKSCETDSDIVRAIVSEHGFDHKGMRELNKLAGSAAIACVSEKHPGKLLLARSGSPLVFGWTKSGDKMYWASEAKAILQASRPFYQVRGTWVQDARADINISSMPNDTAWVFGPEDMELHHKFATCSYYRQPDYSKGRENYHSKMKNWKRALRHHTLPLHAVTTTTPVYRGPQNEAFNKETKEAVLNIGGVIHEHLKGAICKCPGCGTPVSNPKGYAWRTLNCPSCRSGME